MTLSPERRDAIYNSVHAALLHDYCQTTRLDVDMIAAIKAVTDVVHSAAADAAERFNAAACGLLTRLPPELLVQAFSHLPLSDIVRLTRTSRLIRTITRNAPSLWSEIDISRLSYRRSLEGVKHLLAISKRAPLDIEYSSYFDGNEQILHLLASESSRIRSLTINGSEAASSAAFFMQPMPRLRSLVSCSPQVTMLNSDWAPNARYVEIRGPFALPSAGRSPFCLLTHFWGWLPSDARRLFRLCPLLVNLRLEFITPDSVPFLPEAPIPDTLVDIHLESDCDLTSYIEQFYGMHLRNVRIDGAHAAQCILPLWSSYQHASWTMDIVPYIATIEDDDKRMCFTFNESSFEAALAVLGTSCFVNLTKLTIQCWQMDAMIEQIDTLPSLIQLELDLLEWPTPRQPNSNTLCVPRLYTASLVLFVSDLSKLSKEKDLLQSRLCLTADDTVRLLPRLVLKEPSVADVQCAAITALTRYAHDIYVGEHLFWTREEVTTPGDVP
ncbi:hypothetical protein EXIGLDRAFT_773389 [Exidia glandulosa HHB12029]|uniref:F-box domain-containing protein n=1 Tax=Exidia glandulosa HHB12029 TaxID=1314781 RepID=A0A165ETV0_EXIGL|nr:hypothetical protein EXIGLDRAFT_773389 [Exidia glandulosa HHB12029]